MPVIENFSTENPEKMKELRDKAGLPFREPTEEELGDKKEAEAVCPASSEEEPDEREVR
jgi:hypothetical protein